MKTVVACVSASVRDCSLAPLRIAFLWVADLQFQGKKNLWATLVGQHELVYFVVLARMVVPCFTWF
jgi:hypothetical protein